MDINKFKMGNLAKAGNTIGEVVAIDPSGYFFELKSATGALTEVDKIAIEPILLERRMLIDNFGFDENGRLKINIDSRFFYFQEKEGHIILMEENMLPLIHFWDLKTLHQLQNFYYTFTGKSLPFNLKSLQYERQNNAHARLGH